MSKVTQSDNLRRVRPWLTFLLTFLGWGLGAYYSGKTRLAVQLSIFQFLASLLLVSVLLWLIFYELLSPTFLPNPNSFTFFDATFLFISLPIAIFVFTRASSIKNATNRGLTGLFGYAGLWALPMIASAAVTLIISTYFVQPLHIPSGSMQPTIAVNDYVFVDKRRFRDQSINPNRGDIVIFKNKKDRNLDYVSRIIGMPEDVVTIQYGEVAINGEKIPRQLDSTNIDGSKKYLETLGNGTTYMTFDHGIGPLDNVGPYNVPPGHYFFISDNRDRAQDSRVTSMVGYIAREDLRGPVIKIIRNKE